MHLKYEIQKIQLYDVSKIAKVLSRSKEQAGKYKRGYTGLTNEQALLLKEKLGLEPKAFNAIYQNYQKGEFK